MAMPVDYYISCGMCTLLGLLFSMFAIMNLLHNTGALGSFGHKFGYEMDVVMGGLLGIPHYSKIEFLMLGFAAAGAFLSWTGHELITVLGLACAASYMLICALYAHFANLWQQEGAPFVVMGGLSLCLAGWRWARFLNESEWINASLGVGCFAALIVIAGVIMMIRAPARSQLNERFAKIMAYCDENKDFVWLNGEDKPEGFPDPLIPKSA